MVLTENGLIPIENIEVGDFVWSEDPETGDITLKEVEKTFINKTDTLVFITINGDTIKTTEGHLFYVEDIGWLPASMLQEGDILSLEDGREIPIQNIKIVDYNHYISVYNFEVDDYHTYYVSDSSVLVHNYCDNSNIEDKIEENMVFKISDAGKPAKRGNAGIGSDGYPIEIHHINQSKDGPFIEMTRTDHRLRANYKKNHPNYNKKTDIDRKEFNKQKKFIGKINGIVIDGQNKKTTKYI